MSQQIFKVTSPNARCLLSDPVAHVTLTGYSDFKKMMQYRLDKERALVLVSAVTFEEDAPCMVSVEHMQKISQDDAATLTESTTVEWKSVLTTPEDLCKEAYWAGGQEYWSPEKARKVRRLQSEPTSPKPSCG